VGVSAVVYFGESDPRLLLTAMFVVPIVGVLMPLWRLGEIPTAGMRTMANVAGPFYIGGLLTSIALLRRDQGDVGPHFVVMTLTFAWLGDTGGYFFGRFLGKTKLYEAISPKKTRAGFFGSLVGSALGATVAHFWYLPSIPLGHALPLAVFAGALGQLGDLVESLLKRSTGIKDSGWIVPGHGGLLDRIDALLIVSPIVYLYTIWIR
jgi:phosphatidate cytidylyltransferase